MILVDIYVPSVDKEYNFSLNETVSVKTIIEEISEMIGQKEQTELKGAIQDLCLCDRGRELPLPGDKSLEDCGIETGASLILV